MVEYLYLMKIAAMKMIILLFLVAILLLSMAACSDPTGIFGPSTPSSSSSHVGKGSASGGGSHSSGGGIHIHIPGSGNTKSHP